MKKVIVIIFTLCYFYSGAQTIVGKIESGKPIITIETNTLKQKWEAALIDLGVQNPNLSDFIIVTSNDGTISLKAKDNTVRDGKYSKHAVKLIPVNNGGLVGLAVGEISCTCSGDCTEGCDPQISGSTATCTQCWPSIATCKKSTTLKQTGLF